jgi:hypothetical protein
MKDKTTLSGVLGVSTEAQPDGGATAGAKVTNYARRYTDGSHDWNGNSNTELGAAPNNTTDEMDADAADIVWAAFGNGSNKHIVGKLVIAYDGAHNSSVSGLGSETDSACLPLTAHSFDITPDGSDISALITNFFRAVDG